MHAQPQLGPIATAMEVCDVEGNKIGTVARLYRRGAKEGRLAGQPDRPEIVEVKTGFFGWGEHLYIPLSAVADATSHSLYLSRPKRELDQSWRKKLSDLVPVR
jgi:hypothetical protein